MPTPTPLLRVLLPYGTAILTVGAVLALKTVLAPQVAVEGPFLLFLGAILFTAWSGGVGPGLLATVLAALAIDYFFLPPLYRVLANDFSKDLRLAQFLAEGAFISVLSGLRLRSSRHAHRRAEELAVTLRCIGDAVVTTGADGRVTFLNPRAEELTGWSSGEAAGRPAADVLCLLDEATRERVSGPVVESLRTGRVSALESRRLLVSRAGPERPVDDTAAPIRDRSGQLLGVVMVFRDASERRQVEAARTETLRRTTAILESISDAFYALDRDWRFTYLNAHALAYLGRPADSLLGRTLWEVIPHALGTDTERGFRAAVAAGTPARFETRAELTARWVAVVAYPSQEGLAVYFRDITAEKEAEAVLRRSHAALEYRVEEQGAELARTTDSLEAEAALRRQAEHARRQLVARLTTISEDERRRISRELHDETSQLLATLIVGLKAVRDRVASDGTANRRWGCCSSRPSRSAGRSTASPGSCGPRPSTRWGWKRPCGPGPSGGRSGPASGSSSTARSARPGWRRMRKRNCTGSSPRRSPTSSSTRGRRGSVSCSNAAGT